MAITFLDLMNVEYKQLPYCFTHSKVNRDSIYFCVTKNCPIKKGCGFSKEFLLKLPPRFRKEWKKKEGAK